MELVQPKLLDRLLTACLEHGIKPALAKRYHACCYDYLKFLKGDGDWVDPRTVGRNKVEDYLDDLERRGVSRELQGLAFEVLTFFYHHVCGKPGLVVNHQTLLIQRLHDKIGQLNYSPNTAKTYSSWVNDFYSFHNVPPWDSDLRSKLTVPLIERWLTSLHKQRNTTGNTQNLAMSAILFVSKHLFGMEIKGIDALRSKRPQTLPTVLSREQVADVLNLLEGEKLVLAMLGYGCGLRISEAISLRVKDVLFHRRQIHVHDAKGQVDRIVPLPAKLIPLLQSQISDARKWHELDLRASLARVPLPGAFHEKSPNAERSWEWFWVFPSHVRSECPKTKHIGRFHVDESGINRTLHCVARKLQLPQRLHFHVLRHCFATHLLDQGENIRRVQSLLAHKSLETTMRYTHVALTGNSSSTSPLDSLDVLTAAKASTSPQRLNLVG